MIDRDILELVGLRSAEMLRRYTASAGALIICEC